MRHCGFLILAIALAAACAAPRAQEPTTPARQAMETKAAAKGAQSARPTRGSLSPTVLGLLLAEASAPLDALETRRAVELTPPAAPTTLCGAMLPASPRYHLTGKYGWLRNDFARALAWVLVDFWWDAPHLPGQARELCVGDLCAIDRPDVEPDHPRPAHGNGLRWADIHYPTLGASNLTQAPYAPPAGLAYTSIWQGQRSPVALDCARTWWLWDSLARVFPHIGIEVDRRILEAVRTWVSAHHADPACLSRVSTDPPGRWQHDMHMHLDLGDTVDAAAMGRTSGALPEGECAG